MVGKYPRSTLYCRYRKEGRKVFQSASIMTQLHCARPVMHLRKEGITFGVQYSSNSSGAAAAAAAATASADAVSRYSNEEEQQRQQQQRGHQQRQSSSAAAAVTASAAAAATLVLTVYRARENPGCCWGLLWAGGAGGRGEVRE